MSARRLLVCLFATAALLAGCQSTITGNPVAPQADPTEPSVPTTRPPRTTTAPPVTPGPSPSATPAPPAAEELPTENGWAFVETKSGKTRCQVGREEVGCESAFTDPPEQNGMPANGVRFSADGTLEWVAGNLGDIPAVTLDYRTYHALGWTIEASESGTRFTNDRTGRGMFVAVEGVQTF